MKQSLQRLNFIFSKKASRTSSSFIWRLLGIIALLIMLVPWLGHWVKPLDFFSRLLVDILSPDSLRNIPYDTKNHSFAWFSSIAYALGIILISGLLIPIVTNHLRTLGDRYRSGTLSHYVWRGHILFLGYDDMMTGALRRMCSMGSEVIVAVPDKVESIRDKLKICLNEVEFGRVEVIQCNKTDRSDLERKACVREALLLFVIGQPDDDTHDATNIKTLDIVSEMIDKKTNLTSYVYIRNRASLSLVQRQGFDDAEANWLRRQVIPFNFYEEMATQLLTGFEHGMPLMTLDYLSPSRNLAVCAHANVHLVILGMTEMGMALAREVLMVAHYPGRRVIITLVDENAREEMFFFCGRYKELFRHCKHSFEDLDSHSSDPMPALVEPSLINVEFEFIQCNIAHPGLMGRIEAWAGDGNQLLTLAICSPDSSKNMATALYLPRPLLEGERTIPVWVYQQGDDSLKEFGGHDFYKNIHTFSANGYCRIDLHDSVVLSWVDAVANAYATVAAATPKSWNEMTQYERWSSLYNARSIFAKLRAFGYEFRCEDGCYRLWRFSSGRREYCGKLEFTNEELDMLSEAEHIRWNAYILTRGFRPTSPEEHDKIKLDGTLKKRYGAELFAHDDLRPYSDLDPITASYDAQMTSAIIDIVNDCIK